jgi:hypothetical protein
MCSLSQKVLHTGQRITAIKLFALKRQEFQNCCYFRMSRDSRNIKEVAVGGSQPDRCWLYSYSLYSVCTAVDCCDNYRGVHECALFLTAFTELPTTNKYNNGDLYYHQRMINFCLVWNSCFILTALTQHGTTQLSTSMQAAKTKGIEIIYDNFYKLRRVFTLIWRSVIFISTSYCNKAHAFAFITNN